MEPIPNKVLQWNPSATTDLLKHLLDKIIIDSLELELELVVLDLGIRVRLKDPDIIIPCLLENHLTLSPLEQIIEGWGAMSATPFESRLVRTQRQAT